MDYIGLTKNDLRGLGISVVDGSTEAMLTFYNFMYKSSKFGITLSDAEYYQQAKKRAELEASISAMLMASNLTGSLTGNANNNTKVAEPPFSKFNNGKGASEGASSKLPNQGTIKGDITGAPLVDAGKQGKHVSGHNNYSTGKSSWTQGQTGINETQQAWQKGQQLPDGTKVWDSGRSIGSNGETGVRVHIDGNGNIHGYPVNPKQYLP